MSPTPRTWPTFSAELLAARATLRLPDEVGLAIRADRHRLHLSQRAYAVRRRMSNAMVARLEARSGELKLDDVIRALEGTAFVLCLCHRSGEGESPALAGSVPQNEVHRLDPEVGPPTAHGQREPSAATPVRSDGADGADTADSAPIADSADSAHSGRAAAPTPVSPLRCHGPRCGGGTPRRRGPTRRSRTGTRRGGRPGARPPSAGAGRQRGRAGPAGTELWAGSREPWTVGQWVWATSRGPGAMSRQRATPTRTGSLTRVTPKAS